MEKHLQEWEEYDARLLDDSSTPGSSPASHATGRHSQEAGEGPFLLSSSHEAATETETGIGEAEWGETEGSAEHGGPQFEQEAATEMFSSDENANVTYTRENENIGETHSFETDPYAAIRPAMAPEHANLSADEITLVLGRMPATVVLHQMVNSPQMRQATLASFLGKAARRSVRVNGRDISIPTYLRLISRLSGEVAEQSEAEITSDTPSIECTYPPAVVISGYSEYSFQPTADQKVLITRAAQQIVESFATNTPIVVAQVVGHADTALRKPISERAKFEMEVSIRRAQSATQDLKAEIARLGHGKNPEPSVKFADPVGMGATKKLISNPQNVTQMKINRRVEIYFGQCTIPTHWTWIDTALRGVAIVPADTDAHKRIRCMLSLLLKLGEKAEDGYLDYQNWKGLFFPPGFSEEQKERLLRNAITHVEKQLGVRSVYGPANDVSDREFVSALESIDEVITRSMRDFKLNAETSGASVIIIRGWKLIQANRLNPNSIYSCYASYSW